MTDEKECLGDYCENPCNNGFLCTKNADSITCPFCSEKDLDLIGLKYHLFNYCKQYQEIDISEI